MADHPIMHTVADVLIACSKEHAKSGVLKVFKLQSIAKHCARMLYLRNCEDADGRYVTINLEAMARRGLNLEKKI